MSASISFSSQVTATSVVVGVTVYGFTFCLNGQQVVNGSAIQLPYSATLASGTITVTVTIEFSPAT